jgi:EpsI family protein
MIGHLSDMRLATGVDHILYGWLFFGAMVAGMLWLGSRFRDGRYCPPPASTDAITNRPMGRMFAASLASLGVASAVPAYASYAAYLQHANADETVALTAPAPANGWEKTSDARLEFTPHFFNSRVTVTQYYRKGGDRVGVFIAYYRGQRAHGEMISSQNSVVASEERMWRKIGEARIDDDDFPAHVTQLKHGDVRLLVWHSYWVDEAYTASPHWAKFLQVRSQLFRATDEAAAVFIFAAAASSVLDDFVRNVDIRGTLENASED